MEKSKIVVSYDLQVKPENATIDQILHAMKEYGFIFYDSFDVNRRNQTWHPPAILSEDSEKTAVVIDINTEEGKKIYQRVIQKMKDGRK